jgi:hypothetical protein
MDRVSTDEEKAKDGKKRGKWAWNGQLYILIRQG